MQPTGNFVADTICRTTELGFWLNNATDNDAMTHLWVSPREEKATALTAACSAKNRDHTTRKLIDLPIVGYPTRLHVRLPRFTCTNQECSRRIFQDPPGSADDGKKLTKRAIRWIMQRLAIDRMSVAATGQALGVGWDLVNQVACKAARKLVFGDSTHLEGERIIGVDEHVWKHTHRSGHPSAFVTVIVDLTPIDDGAGPAWLLDMKPGRSGEVLRSWLADTSEKFRKNVKLVAMDGFAGFATAVD